MHEPGAGRVVVCRVGSQRFALPVAAVRQVVAAPPVSRLPGAPEAVQGIANVHGTLVTTLSGPRLLGLPIGEKSEWLIVLSLCEGRVGIEVDEVEDVEEGSGQTIRTLDLEALIRPLLSEPT
ncbi:MAG TPA: chemotaxis protein CheW [Gemmatimonadales bacterium]|jgi:purine-binding chemotaxis protein CheW